MKAIIIFLTLMLLPISVAFAQTPPSDISAGVIVRNGGHADYAVQASGNINIIKSTNASGVATSQAYVQLGVIFADDIYFSDGEIKELEALTGFAIVKKYIGKFSLGTGVGVMSVQREGDNDYKAPFLLKVGYNLFDFCRIGVVAEYAPIKDEGDLVFTGVNLGITP